MQLRLLHIQRVANASNGSVVIGIAVDVFRSCRSTQPDLGLLRKIEAARQDADDLVRLAFHAQQLTDGSLRATQFSIGESFAHQGLVRCVALAKERSSDSLHAEDIWKLRADCLNLRKCRMVRELHAHLSAVIIGNFRRRQGHCACPGSRHR